MIESAHCASWLEDYTEGNAKLERVCVNFRQSVDFYVEALLKIGKTEALLETAFDRNNEKKVILYGTTGRIEIPDLHRATKAIFYQNNMEPYEIELNYEYDDFYGQIRHFCDCLSQNRTESDLMPLDASMRCAEFLDIIREGFNN